MAGACRTADRLVGRLGRDADRAVIFALNIDLPGGMKDAPKREAIVRSILQSIGTSAAETCTGFHGASHL